MENIYHAFSLTPTGWVLSPLFDVNPVPYGDELSLNVNEDDNRIDIELAVQTAVLFGIGRSDAQAYAAQLLGTVRENWDRIAAKYGLSRRENGMVKVITGIRRCGKSYLLFELYHQYLNAEGVTDDHIIELALDEDENARYRNPVELGQYIRNLLVDKDKMYYVFLDEIQKVVDVPNPYLPGTEEKIGFVDVLLGLMKIKNMDLYVTGSNSKMLSTDILTEFRGRGDEVRVNPLSYQEFYAAYGEDKRNAWRDYFTFGGMPLVLAQKTSEDKSRYLHSLFDKIYLDDIMFRHNIVNEKIVLDDLLDIVSSSVGSLTNPSKIQKTFVSVKGTAIADDTISRYLDYFMY